MTDAAEGSRRVLQTSEPDISRESVDAAGPHVTLPTEDHPRIPFHIPHRAPAPSPSTPPQAGDSATEEPTRVPATGVGRADETTGDGGEASVGVLVMHGFTGSVYSIRDWALSLSPDYTVTAPALPGHRTRWQDLATTSWGDWYDHVAEHLRSLQADHDRVVVAGLSMGGALALRLAECFGHDDGERPVDGVVVVNPGLSTRNPAAPAAKVIRHVMASAPGIGSDIAKAGAEEHAYPRTPVAGVAQLNELMRVTTKELGNITAPVLILRSRHDHVVSDAAHERIMARSSGPVETVILPRSFHVATLDHDAPVVNARTRSFVAAIAAGRCPITGTALAPIPREQLGGAV